MFRNYPKIDWRNLVRNKVYSIINIVRLAVGIGLLSSLKNTSAITPGIDAPT